MKETEIPALSLEETEALCKIAEDSARRFVLSKISSSKIADLNVTVDVEGTKPLTVNVEVEIKLSPQVEGYDVQKVADEAVKNAFRSIEEHLRGLSCKSTR